MYSQAFTVACLVAAGLPLAAGQRGYANILAPLEKDDDVVAENFPDVEDIELLSPAFINPDSVPEDFTNGTSTSTPLDDLGQ